MTTFTTTIERMYTMPTPEPNYVVNLHWKVVGVDGQYTAQIDGSTQFDSSQQEGAFVPYPNLTPQIVIGWIPQNQIDSAQACVQGQIDSLISPPVSPEAQPLPWSNT